MFWRKKKPDPAVVAVQVIARAVSDFAAGTASIAKILDTVTAHYDAMLSHVAKINMNAMYEIRQSARQCVAASAVQEGDPLTSRTVASAMAYEAPLPSTAPVVEKPDEVGLPEVPHYPSEPPDYADEELVGAEPPPRTGPPTQPTASSGASSS